MEEFYIDFDGVILDSQERFNKHMGNNIKFKDWIEYLNSIEWESFFKECKEIDDSVDCLKKLAKLKKLKAITTRIHVYEEGIEKINYLRNNGIVVPVCFVLPNQSKSIVIPPKKNMVLIDDDVQNCIEWEKDGGSSILFDPNSKGHYKTKIKSLKEIL